MRELLKKALLTASLVLASGAVHADQEIKLQDSCDDRSNTIEAVAYDNCCGCFYVGTANDQSAASNEQNGTRSVAIACLEDDCFIPIGDNIANHSVNGLALVGSLCPPASARAIAASFDEQGQSNDFSNQIAVRCLPDCKPVVDPCDPCPTDSWLISGVLQKIQRADCDDPSLENQTDADAIAHITASCRCVIANTTSGEDADGPLTGPQFNIYGELTGGGDEFSSLNGVRVSDDCCTLTVGDPMNIDLFTPVLRHEDNSICPDAVEVRDLYYDKCLETLYVGLRVIAGVLDTSEPEACGGYYTVVKATLDDDCNFTLSPIASALPDALDGVVGTNTSVDGVDARVDKLRVMHTSTGIDYLIVAGLVNQVTPGDATLTPTAQNHFVRAVPLASKSTANQGCAVQNFVAQANACGGGCRVECPPAPTCDPCGNTVTSGCCQVACECKGAPILCAPLTSECDEDSELVFANGFAFADCDATVGVCNPIWDISAEISDMVVQGDTVYVSTAAHRAATEIVDSCEGYNSDTGIFMSHAMFNHCGQIVSWTKWERAYPSKAGCEATVTCDNATNTLEFGSEDDGDRVRFFAVDARTGKMWKVNADGTEVRRTQWICCPVDPCLEEASLASVICDCLCDGVFSIHDLCRATPMGNDEQSEDDPLFCNGVLGFEPTHNFVLFGGIEKVLFLHTGQGDNAVTKPNQYPSEEHSLCTTDCLAGAGSILSLGYTNRVDCNFFLAGSQNGFYVYGTQDGNCFDTGATPFTDLNSPPFDRCNDRWHRLPCIERPVPFMHVIHGRTLPDECAEPVDDTTCVIEDEDGEELPSYLFFVGLDVCSQNGIVDELYRTHMDGDVDDVCKLANNLKVVARSGQRGIHANATFTGFTIVGNICNGEVSCSPDPITIQDTLCEACAYYGVLATNDGIYVTKKDIRCLTPFSDFSCNTGQVDCITSCPPAEQCPQDEVCDEWCKICRTDDLAFTFLRNASKRPDASQTVWGIFLADGKPGTDCPGIFQNSRFIQLGNISTLACNDDACTVEGLVLTDPNCTVVVGGSTVNKTEVRMTPRPDCCEAAPSDRQFWTGNCVDRVDQALTLWSDGNRRFYSRFSADEDRSNSVHSLPFDCCSWCMCAPYPIEECLACVQRVNVIENLSATGDIIVGTDSGVAVLT